jgi:hypothetical protein
MTINRCDYGNDVEQYILQAVDQIITITNDYYNSQLTEVAIQEDKNG